MKETDKIPNEDWRRIVLLAESQKNEVLRNDSSAHTLLVTKLMVRRMGASDKLVIYSRALRMPFYAEILKKVKCPVRVLLDSEEGISVIRSLPERVQGVIDCRLMKHPSTSHFLVAGNGFRFAEQLDSVVDSVANFNDPNTSRCLRERFNLFWEEAVPRAILV